MAATVSYNSLTNTATLTPNSGLANGTLYMLTVVGGESGVKDLAGNALATNIFSSFTTVPAADTTPPTVVSVTPLGASTGVPVNTPVTVTFSEALNVASVTTSTILLRDSGNNTVAATVSYNAATKTVTLTPIGALSELDDLHALDRRRHSGVKDLAGNALATNVFSSFTTIAAASSVSSLWSSSTTPATVDGGDGQAIELGVKFTANTSGYITGVEFYKAAANTGVHTGSLWSSTGQLLATGTFMNETATGWQTLVFSTPVADGRHSLRGWLPHDDGPLLCQSIVLHLVLLQWTADRADQWRRLPVRSRWIPYAVLPGKQLLGRRLFSSIAAGGYDSADSDRGSSGRRLDRRADECRVTVTFSEALECRHASTPARFNCAIRTTISSRPRSRYNSSTKTAMLTPTSPLANSTTYMITIVGGASGVKDLAGNALAANVYSSFTTIAAASSVASLWIEQHNAHGGRQWRRPVD